MKKTSLKDPQFTVLMTKYFHFFQRLFFMVKLLVRYCLSLANQKQIQYFKCALLCNKQAYSFSLQSLAHFIFVMIKQKCFQKLKITHRHWESEGGGRIGKGDGKINKNNDESHQGIQQQALQKSVKFRTSLETLFASSLVIPGSEPSCIVQMTEATCGKFTYYTDGFQSVIPVTSQKTTLNSPQTSKLDER